MPCKISVSSCTLSSQLPWGRSFLRHVCLTFLQFLCTAPCHSNKFLCYHCVSLNNFYCLPPKIHGKGSRIQKIVWPAGLVGQQPLPAKKPLLGTRGKRRTLRSSKFRLASAHGYAFAGETYLAVTQDGLENVRSELLINHCLSQNCRAL